MDEAFFSEEQMERRYPGLHAGIRRYIESGCTAWPAAVPKDFDHEFLRSLGLACGADGAPRQYTLLQVTGGWRVYPVDELVDAIMQVARDLGR